MTPPVTPQPPTAPAHGLLSLRTCVILAIGLLVAGGIATLTIVTGLSLVEILVSTGAAFSGTVGFLHAIVH